MICVSGYGDIPPEDLEELIEYIKCPCKAKPRRHPQTGRLSGAVTTFDDPKIKVGGGNRTAQASGGLGAYGLGAYAFPLDLGPPRVWSLKNEYVLCFLNSFPSLFLISSAPQHYPAARQLNSFSRHPGSSSS